jgi:hypothetical protein
MLQLPWLEVIGMRLILKQPSPEWKSFSIEELAFFKVNITNQQVSCLLPVQCQSPTKR